MNLTKLNVEATLRLTLDNTDIQVDLMKTVVIDPNMYKLLFMDLPSGNVYGKDDPVGIRTGFKAQVFDVADNIESTPSYTTDLALLDWYEDETFYYAQALMTKAAITVAADKYVSFVRIVYQGSDGAATPAAVTYDILESSAPAGSKLAVSNGGTPALTGLKVEAAQTPLTINCNLSFKIAK
jgi:hypothetical protein